MCPDEKGPGSKSLQAKWDERYRRSERVPHPASVLAGNLHLLPARGAALDLACGLGANALLLAEKHLRVTAWDVSTVAMECLRKEARQRGLQIATQVRDVQERPPGAHAFDVIVVSHFLDRDLTSALEGALRPGGLLFYQTFSRDAVTGCGPSNPAFRLDTNELLVLFQGLVVRYYREEGNVGDPARGTRDVVQLIAQKLCGSGRVLRG